MSFLYSQPTQTTPLSEYFNSKGNPKDLEALKNSSTVYIGNLSYFTTELQIYSLFSLAGKVKKVILGINKFTKTPCGFAFVEFEKKESADIAVNHFSGSFLDSRPLRVDRDVGFSEGRQYGRGRSGGQKRDEFQRKEDPQRPLHRYGNKNNYNSDKYGRDKYYDRNRYSNDKYGKDRYRNDEYNNRDRHHNNNNEEHNKDESIKNHKNRDESDDSESKKSRSRSRSLKKSDSDKED